MWGWPRALAAVLGGPIPLAATSLCPCSCVSGSLHPCLSEYADRVEGHGGRSPGFLLGFGPCLPSFSFPSWLLQWGGH